MTLKRYVFRSIVYIASLYIFFFNIRLLLIIVKNWFVFNLIIKLILLMGWVGM